MAHASYKFILYMLYTEGKICCARSVNMNLVMFLARWSGIISGLTGKPKFRFAKETFRGMSTVSDLYFGRPHCALGAALWLVIDGRWPYLRGRNRISRLRACYQESLLYSIMLKKFEPESSRAPKDGLISPCPRSLFKAMTIKKVGRVSTELRKRVYSCPCL